MTMDLSRSIHPDLLEEYQQLSSGIHKTNDPSQPGPRRRRGRGASPAVDAVESDRTPPPGDQPTAETPDAPTGDSGAAPPGEASEPSAPPEWLAQLRTTTEPREMLKLLVKNVPRDEMEQDDTLRGWLGDYANQRARKMLEEQARQQQEQQRQQAYDRGDLYALGQLTAADLQAQRAALQAQSETAVNPYMVGIRNFQAALPEDVQREVQDKHYDSFGAYLTAVQDAAIRHGVQAEVSKRTAALQKAELSSTVGSEQSPELDGGPAQAYREITDAQVAAMTLEEYDRYFDEKGRPRAGVRVRLERGIDVSRR